MIRSRFSVMLLGVVAGFCDVWALEMLMVVMLKHEIMNKIKKIAQGEVYEKGDSWSNTFAGDGRRWRKWFISQGWEERYYWKVHKMNKDYCFVITGSVIFYINFDLFFCAKITETKNTLNLTSKWVWDRAHFVRSHWYLIHVNYLKFVCWLI